MPPKFDIKYNSDFIPDYDKHFTKTSAGFRTKNSRMIKSIFSFIGNISDQVNLNFTEEGIKIMALDNSHISLINMLLPTELFSIYKDTDDEGTPITLGLDIKVINKVFNRLNFNDEIVFNILKKDTFDISFINTKYSKCYCIKLLDIDCEDLNVYDAEDPVEITIDSKYFNEIINDFNDIGEDITINIDKSNSAESVSLICESPHELGLEMALCNEDLRINGLKDIKLDFALKNLINFSKGYTINKNMTIQLHNSNPLKLTYKIMDKGYINYYIAPKIEEDD